MKRKIEVTTPNVKIVAVIHTDSLVRDEVQTVVDELSDTLMRTAADVRWIGCPLNKVRVK